MVSRSARLRQWRPRSLGARRRRKRSRLRIRSSRHLLQVHSESARGERVVLGLYLDRLNVDDIAPRRRVGKRSCATPRHDAASSEPRRWAQSSGLTLPGGAARPGGPLAEPGPPALTAQCTDTRTRSATCSHSHRREACWPGTIERGFDNVAGSPHFCRAYRALANAAARSRGSRGRHGR